MFGLIIQFKSNTKTTIPDVRKFSFQVSVGEQPRAEDQLEEEEGHDYRRSCDRPLSDLNPVVRTRLKKNLREEKC